MSTVQGARRGWVGYGDVNMTARSGYSSTRLEDYDVADGYFYNNMYDDYAEWALSMRVVEHLYKHTTATKNPVPLAISLLVSHTFKGEVDTDTLQDGCIPLRYNNAALEAPLKQLLSTSGFETFLTPFATFAALYGDAPAWIAVDLATQRIRYQLLHPSWIKYAEFDEVGDVQLAVIEYQKADPVDPDKINFNSISQTVQQKTYTYRMVVSKTKFRTYKDNKPFAYVTNGRGEMVDEWDNEYGFVPLKLGHYEKGIDGWGRNCISGVPLKQINAYNDHMSIIRNSSRRTLEPILQATGVQAESEIDASQPARDGVKILFLSNPDAELKSITPQLDYSGANQTLEMLGNDLEKSFPILSLLRIREFGGNASGKALRTMFGDALAQIENFAKNIYPPIVDLLQMGVSMAAHHGFEGYGGFDLESYKRGDLAMRILPPHPFDDTLSPGEKVDKLKDIADLPEGTKRQALKELDYSEVDIEIIMTADKSEQEEKTRMAVRGLVDSAFGDDDEDETDLTDPEDEDAIDTEAQVLEKAA